MTALPFEDMHLDVVLSPVAVHTSRQAGRHKVIEEAVRVLRPSGWLRNSRTAGVRLQYSIGFVSVAICPKHPSLRVERKFSVRASSRIRPCAKYRSPRLARSRRPRRCGLAGAMPPGLARTPPEC